VVNINALNSHEVCFIYGGYCSQSGLEAGGITGGCLTAVGLACLFAFECMSSCDKKEPKCLSVLFISSIGFITIGALIGGLSSRFYSCN
jgi:hypothetical protein